MVAGVLAAFAAVTFSAQAAIHTSFRASGNYRVGSSVATRRAASRPGLTFGIYPGGGAGTVGPAGRTLAENSAEKLAALKQLRVPGRPFVLHIFASYTGSGSSSPASQVGSDIARYTAAGFEVEVVLRYQPSGGTPASNIAGFAGFVRSAIDTFGPNPRFVGVQVTNEANVRGAPNAADGAYSGVQDALINGVVAAKQEARKRGFARVRIGFNWAYSAGSGEKAFWRRLGRVGGHAFRSSLDWVGLDVYPETWGPDFSGSLATATKKTVLASLDALRNRFMPLAGLSTTLPLHISENGYPTGPSRTEKMQVTVMKTAIATIYADRLIYHVTDYRWFDLRDADSSSRSFQSRYGLMHDDYTPKLGFAVYHNLVAKL